MKRNLQSARWIGLVLCASLSSFWIPECAAGPLVLRGTATVATVNDDSNFPGIIGPLPFAAHVGDTFPFVLSIESQQPAPDQASGHAKFYATIGGAQLQHPQLEVRVRNDLGVSVLTLAEPRDVDIVAIVGDQILIRKPHQFGATDYIGTTNVAGSLPFRLELGFLEYVGMILPEELQVYPTILNDASIPQTAATWQAFFHRELAIRFTNRSFLGAYINTITLVPEPSSFSICGFSCLLWLGSRFARRRPTTHFLDIASEQRWGIVPQNSRT